MQSIIMANCPKCGSDHIQIKRETDVSWGRAVAGWALFGVVGGAVGAVTGEAYWCRKLFGDERYM